MSVGAKRKRTIVVGDVTLNSFLRRSPLEGLNDSYLFVDYKEQLRPGFAVGGSAALTYALRANKNRSVYSYPLNEAVDWNFVTTVHHAAKRDPSEPRTLRVSEYAGICHPEPHFRDGNDLLEKLDGIPIDEIVIFDIQNGFIKKGSYQKGSGLNKYLDLDSPNTPPEDNRPKKVVFHTELISSLPRNNGAAILLDLLQAKYKENLVVCLEVDALRRAGCQISRGLSWEQTLVDISSEFQNHSQPTEILYTLAKCSTIVIRIGFEGAVLRIQRKDVPVQISLIYEKSTIEGEYAETLPKMPDKSAIFLAALAGNIWSVQDTESSSKPPDAQNDGSNPNFQSEMESAIKQGLTSLRRYVNTGFSKAYYDDGKENQEEELKDIISFDNIQGQLKGEQSSIRIDGIGEFLWFNRKEVVRYREPDDQLWSVCRYPEAEVAETSSKPHWSLVNLPLSTTGTGDSVEDRILRFGEFPSGLPIATYGRLTLATRKDIEMYRNTRLLMKEYIIHPNPDRPLSIAVFGRPGSGKSFGIKELVADLKENTKANIEILAYNLAEFNSTADLMTAFHAARDVAIKRSTPLIFFDEFDCRMQGNEYAWLKTFLAPMQDGEFKDGEGIHKIGKAIFVFAGGINWEMKQFDAVFSVGGLPKDDGLSKHDSRAAKGLDFISRLKGFLDIDDLGKVTENYKIRRAIQIRTNLNRYFPHLFVQESGNDKVLIDPAVSFALLEVDKYKHSARSLEAILTMSSLSNAATFGISALPRRDQMEIHVDSKEFFEKIEEGRRRLRKQ